MLNIVFHFFRFARYSILNTVYTFTKGTIFGGIKTALILDSFIMGADGQLPISPHMF
jgi:hypothetical protein